MARKSASAAVAEAPPKPLRIDPDTRQPIPPGQLGDWGDDIPEEVVKARDAYINTKRTRAKAHEEMTRAKQNVTDKMIEFGVKKLKIDEGEKYLVLETHQEVKIKTIKSDAKTSSGAAEYSDDDPEDDDEEDLTFDDE